MANVLIVDDSKFMRSMLSDILTKEGHQIEGEAENAKEAIEIYPKLKVDLVTLDIIMPEVEGVDAISALKAIMEVNSEAKVVVVSSMGQEEIIREFIQAGAKDFILKPFRSSHVVAAVNKVLWSP